MACWALIWLPALVPTFLSVFTALAGIALVWHTGWVELAGAGASGVQPHFSSPDRGQANTTEAVAF